MAALLLLILSVIISSSNAQPSPGYWPSSKFRSINFYESYKNLWGPQHQQVVDPKSLTIWLDSSTGSGFKSKSPYRSGYFGASIKLHPGYTAGVITSFYLSNSEVHPGNHDEVDIEFLGTTPGKPYTLQTNVYVRGSGDGRIVGREVQFHLWFDPTADYHNYAILWTPQDLIFFVDDIPVRRYRKKIASTFPLRPMWAYGSIWDASSWATESGKYKANYNYQPFVGKYNNFKLTGCRAHSPRSCRTVSGSPYSSGGLSTSQNSAMKWAQNYKVYDYCRDSSRDHSKTPECYA